MRFMKNRIAKVLSVATSFLVTMAVTAKPSAAPRHDEALDLQGGEAGPLDHEHTEEAQHDGGGARGVIASRRTRTARSDPGRRRELEREDGGERQERDAERPGVSRREVHEVAGGAGRGASARDRGAGRPRHGEREQDRDAGRVAERQGLGDREGAREPRTATAVAEKERSAPVIQRTTTMILRWVTIAFVGEP